MSKPTTYSAALPITYVVLRLLIVLNLLMGAAILALLVATIVAEEWTFRALGITAASGIPSMIMGLRAIAALGLFAIPLNHMILARLVAMVETVRGGDAFTAANARRLQAIAWVLLALQLLSITIAAIGKMISTVANPVNLDAGFSINGWLAVL
ncbi:MAG TPA: hypothetical protein VGR05_09575, partial [Sphingomicrobium sp.]|nr:hypothetical protein [Sphingomicrobium sp.]